MSCQYTRSKHDAWGTDWATQCGNTRHIDAPMDVGIAAAPLPNAYAKFCPYCGNEIAIKDTTK